MYKHHQPRSRGFSKPQVPDEDERRFFASTAIDPKERIRLEQGSSQWTIRALDLICPIGRGQRGLIVAPPGSGKTTFLKDICQAIPKGAPDVKLFCLLIDERPEEVTEFKRSVSAEVFASSSDQDYEHHIATAAELMKRCYKEVNNGVHVMVVIDSLTRLGRVHNAQRASSGRTLSGGVDAGAMAIPRRIFGSARNIEGGGSLTILATILVETGSRMDEVIFEEFKGTGNMEIVLSRDIAQHRIFPAVDIHQSATRKCELLMTPEEYNSFNRLRRALSALNKIEAAKALIEKLEKFPTNSQLLSSF